MFDKQAGCRTPKGCAVWGGNKDAVEVEAGLGVFFGIAADGGVGEVGDGLVA